MTGTGAFSELPEGVAADPAALGTLHADTAATGLALLTYLGAGYTHQDEKYRDVVRRGRGMAGEASAARRQSFLSRFRPDLQPR